MHIGRHLAEVRGPWAEEDGLPFRESRTTRLGRVEPGDEDSEDDYVEDELELMERRRLEAIQSERRRPRHYYKADSRYVNGASQAFSSLPLNSIQLNLSRDWGRSNISKLHNNNMLAYELSSHELSSQYCIQFHVFPCLTPLHDGQ